MLLVLIVLGLTLSGADAQTGAYTRLQVLLPGETAAPGTGTGKLGTPEDQTVGVPFQITVRACDDQWETVNTVGDLVHVTSSEASATLPGDANLVAGEAAITVTLNAAGSFTVSAEDLTDATIPTATSAYVTSMLLDGFQFSSINQKNQYAGQPMAMTIWAVDPAGQVITGYSGSVQLREITSYGEGRIEPSVVDLTYGTWSGTVTMYRADETSINRGNVNIYAYLAAQPEKNGTSDPFTVHPGAFTRLQIVVPGQDALPGSVSGLTGSPASQASGQDFVADVFATDPYWNPLPAGDQVRIVSSDPAASTPVTGTLATGHVQLTLSLGTVGAQTLTVNDQTNGSIQGMTSASIAVIPAAVHHFEFGPLPSVATAGVPVAVTIRATDALGNLLPDYDGDAFLSANTGAGTISPESITFSNGLWTGDVTFRGAGGAVSFACSDYATPPHSGTSPSFQVLPGEYVALQVLMPGELPQGGTATGKTGTPDTLSAGSAFNLRVRAVDSYFNRVPGIASRLELTSSDPFMSAPADPALVDGEAVVPVTLYHSGGQTMSAADLDSAGITPGVSAEAQVESGPYARLVLLAPGEELAPGSEEGRSGAATDQSISFAFTMVVLATDSWFNPVTGVTDLVRLTSSDPMAELPDDTPLTDGRADLIVRLSTGGFQQLTVSNLDQPTIPASTTQVRAISSGLHLEAEVSPTAVQAGEAFTVTVKVTNDAGSVIQEINSYVDVVAYNASTMDSGRGTLLNTRFQLLQGVRVMSETYTFAESIVLEISDDAGNTPAITDVIVVSPGAPASVNLACDPTWVRANRTATVSATVADVYGNGVPGMSVDFALTSGTGTLTPLDSETDATGVARAEFLSPRVAEVDHVEASAAGLTGGLDIETALVDPDAVGGTITNYPNPFHPGEAPTTIAYVLADDARVRLRIYTVSGSLVLDREIAKSEQGAVAGLNEVTWDGRNGAGDPVASGGYIVYVEAEGEGATLHVMRRKVAVVW